MNFYKKFSFWILIAVLAFLAFYVFSKITEPLYVKAEKVERRTLDITVTATSAGTIMSDQEINITAQRAGRLSKLLVEEGDEVVEGLLIAEIDPSEAQINLDIARATLKRSQAYLSQLKAASSAFDADVEASIESSRAKFEDIEERYKNNKELLEKGFISHMEFTELESQYNIAKAEYDSALARRNSIDAKKKEIQAQEAAVREAQSNLELAELTYRYSFINAPAVGVITSRPVKLGQTVIKGELVAALITTGSLYIEAFVDEADVDRVELRQRVAVTMDAYPNRVLEGAVFRISPVVLGGRLENRTFEVRTRLSDTSLVLKPGMSADVEIVVESVDNALVVPTQAVIEAPDEQYVYVVSGHKAHKRTIETGLADWTFTQVISGLEENEEVVLTPDVPGLADGARVQVRTSDD